MNKTTVLAISLATLASAASAEQPTDACAAFAVENHSAAPADGDQVRVNIEVRRDGVSPLGDSAVSMLIPVGGPAPYQLTQKVTYAASASETDGKVEVKPGVITTGLRVVVVPVKVHGKAVSVKLCASTTELVAMTRFAAAGLEVESPEVRTGSTQRGALLQNAAEMKVSMGQETLVVTASAMPSPGQQ